MKILCIVFVICMNTQLWGRDVEVRDGEVPVFSERSLSASVLRILKTGDSIECRDRIGDFWEVKISQETWGYVEFSKVRIKIERKKKSRIRRIQEVLQGSGYMGRDPAVIRMRTTITGARGLQDSKDLSAIANNPPNFRLLYLMEAFRVSRSKIENFGEELHQEMK
jgi:hypothetical protein